MKGFLLYSFICMGCCLITLSFAPPAARLNDFHQEPMQDPVIVHIPHVGGPVIIKPNTTLTLPAASIGNMPAPKTGILLQDDPRLHSISPQAVIIHSQLNSHQTRLAIIHQTPLGPVIKPFPH